MVNLKGINREIRRLHLFHSKNLIKTSSFDNHTVDVFQDKEGLRVEFYSSDPETTDDNSIYDLPIIPHMENIWVIWKEIQLENNDPKDKPIDVVMLSIEAQLKDSDDAYIQVYSKVMTSSEDFDLSYAIELWGIDIKDNPTKVD